MKNKETKFFIMICILAIVCTLGISVIANTHVCADNTHVECDGICSCDGYECTNQ